MRVLLHIFVRITAVVSLATAFFGCTRRPAVSEYRSTPLDGWETGETLTFDIDSLRCEGNYLLSLGVRTSAARKFPYKQLILEVRQNWHEPLMSRTDTLTFDIATHTSRERSGISISRYEQPCTTLPLPQGARGTITVRHLMRHNFLPGISEVGILLAPVE